MRSSSLIIFATRIFSSRFASRLTVVFFIMAAVMAAAVAAQNNGPADPKRGAANGASFSMSDIENINLTNGNLMLNMPMVSLPPSRGGLSASLGMTYNSKNLKSIIAPVQVDGQVYDHNVLYESDAGSWRLVQSLGHKLVVINRFQGLDLSPCGPNYHKNGFRWKVKIEFADGQEKEFRPVGYGDQYNDGYFDVSPNGDISSYGYTPGIPPTCNFSTSQHPGPLSYISTDGSYLRMVVQHDNDSDHTNNPFAIYYPDGSYYSSTDQRLTDRYGNYLEPVPAMNYDGRPVLGGVQDQFQRKIFYTKSSSPTAPEYYLYQFGVNGVPVMWTVKTKMIYVQKQYTTTPNSGLRDRGGPQGSGTFSGQFEVVDEITPPVGNGQLKYEFEYDGSDTELGKEDYSVGWGQLIEVKMPSASAPQSRAKSVYTYENGFQDTTDKILERSVSSKTLTYDEEYDGQTLPADSQLWTYSIGISGSTMTAPNGAVTSQVHGSTAYDHPHNGLVKKITNPDGSIVEKVWRTGPNAAVTAEVTTISGGSKAFMKTFAYDQNGNTTLVSEYDFVNPGQIPRVNGNPFGEPTGVPVGALLRTAETKYYNATPAFGGTPATYHYSQFNGIRSLVKSVDIKEGGITTASLTEMMYDLQPFGTVEITTGNLTSQKTWDSAKGVLCPPDSGGSRLCGSSENGNFVSTSAVYNNTYGMPTSTTDAMGRTTVITYGNIGGFNYLYPTQVVTASGTLVARTAATGYDFHTGLITSSTDVDNNNATTYTVYDALGRPTSVTAPNGALATTEYDDIGRKVISRSDIHTNGDQKKVVVTYSDQLGRVRLTRTLEDASSQDEDDPCLTLSNPCAGIKVQTRYKVANGSPGYTYQLTSNPYRASMSSGEDQPTMGWTLSTTSSDGLTSAASTYTGAALPGPFGGNGNSTGTVSTSISGTATTVTDQAGKLRRSITNALGQLIRVDEPTDPTQNGIGSLGDVTSPNQKTEYAYDTLNNLTSVNQGPGIAQRTFSYSSLSRLTSANNPESGPITYLYDNNGNLTLKTDARGVQTTYLYDELNRVKNRNHSDGTPNVTYTYDLINGNSAPNAKGRLTKVFSSVSTTEYTEFDILGRVKKSKQSTDGVEYGGSGTPAEMTYTYNASGGLIEQQYPSGRVVKTNLDTDGDLASVETKKNSAGNFSNYASNFTYNAAKAATGLQLGNGYWESTEFNARLQPTRIALGSSQNATDKLRIDYSYGSPNNGNMASQTITVPGLAQPFVQSYTYDELNRIKTATETSNGSQTWTQVYGFDRFGNRNITSGTGQTSLSFSGNRITTSGYSYDLAGNTIADGSGKTFTYDAENKQKTAVVNGYTNEYFYDGDGKRVKKVVPSTGETTIFVYDAAGKSIAEYSTIVEPVETAKVAYLTNDHLGSPRINTDALGNVTARHDYHPYGEEIATPQRVGQGYTDDTVRKQFTGYERDDESGLDFAEARMFGSSLGRFTAVDPSSKSIIQMNPQTWNRYSYCYNNPIALVDENGKWPIDTHIYLTSITFAGLSKSEMTFVTSGVLSVDGFSDGKPLSTYWPSEAYKHYMTPEGMTPDDAWKAGNDWLNTRLKDARQEQEAWEAKGGEGVSLKALFAVGEASHLYQDMTSPAHGLDKTYSVAMIEIDVAGFKFRIPDPVKFQEDQEKHNAQESRNATRNEEKQAQLYGRTFFLIALDEKHFGRLSMSDEERAEVRAFRESLRKKEK